VDNLNDPYAGDDLDSVLRGIQAELRAANERGDTAKARELEQLAGAARQGSRYAEEGADPSLVEHLAAGGSLRVQPPANATKAGGARGGLAAAVKALAESTPSAGGYLVPPEVAAEVTTLLRARSAVAAMGPTVVPMRKQLLVNSISSGSTAYYTAENAPIPTSEPTFDQDVLLQPKELAALVPVSNRLLRDAVDTPALEGVLRADLAEVLALRQDLAFLAGTGASGTPVGISNTPGITAVDAAGATLDFDRLKSIPAALRSLNAPFARPGWIMHPDLLAQLEAIQVEYSGQPSGLYVADQPGLLTYDRQGAGGVLLGYPFRTTTQIANTVIYFSSDWSELWIGSEQELVIELSTEGTYTPDGGTTWVSAWQNRQTLFRALMCHDLGLRRPALFHYTHGLAAP
jgi:HK97 family phage major capsid protein